MSPSEYPINSGVSWCQRRCIKGSLNVIQGRVCGASRSGFPNNHKLAMRALGGFVGFAIYACEGVSLVARMYVCRLAYSNSVIEEILYLCYGVQEIACWHSQATIDDH